MKKGFTLLELLVVMMLIGILVAIGTGGFVQTQIKARDAQRKNDLGQLQRALESYLNDHGRYPADDAGQIQVPNGVGTVTIAWGEPFKDENNTVYMVKLIKDRTSPIREYYYRSNTAGTKYQLFAALENSEDKNHFSLELVDSLAAENVSCGQRDCVYGIASPNSSIPDTSGETW